MSAFNANWKIDKYKQDHEIDEHWKLKKKFLLAHKDKFPEDELVCLAQVFVNVELLGCRYPLETMKLVAELSQEIVQDFREKRKSKLQRTFVQASDAASSKVKGLKNTPNTSLNQSQASVDEVSIEEKDDCSELVGLDDSDDKDEHPKKRMKIEPELPYGKMILFEYPEDAPQAILTRAANAHGINLEWKYEMKVSIYLNKKLISESEITNKKQAKAEAAKLAIQELKKYYYTIKVKQSFNKEASTVSCNTLRTASKEESLADNNIGNKLMKLMGWTGGGLGKAQQGIVEPVSADSRNQMSRRGLGLPLKNAKVSTMDLKKKCREVVRNFLNDSSQRELVFSSDFTKEERAIMHQVAKQMGVKSVSYGPANNRTLVFSRKIDPMELITELKSVGGRTEKYELVEPVP